MVSGQHIISRLLKKSRQGSAFGTFLYNVKGLSLHMQALLFTKICGKRQAVDFDG